MSKKTTVELTHSFDIVIKQFIKQIESLRETLPLVTIFMSVNESKATQDYLDFVKAKGIEEKGEDGEDLYKFNAEDSHSYRILKKNSEIAVASLDIVKNSLFVSLISQFDSFLGRFIREIFQVKPDILNSSEKNLTFSKLLELKSIDEAKEFIIEKEVEAVLRDSHSDHFDWLENKLGIPLRKDLPIWQEFIEITERRNLFVHNDGIVSSQYLSICRHHKVLFDKEPNVGDRLNITEEYFEKTFRCFFEIAVKLTQVVWRKLLPSQLENADESLNDICFELLRQRHLDLATILLDFATVILKKHYNEETKNVFIVNKALALRMNNKKQECADIVNSKDWSACSDKFKIAKEALLDNQNEVVKLMKKIGSEGEVSKLSYKVWPLFIEFRKTQLFKDAFKEIFGEDYLEVETPKKLLEEIFAKVESEEKSKKVKKRIAKADQN